MSQVRSPVFTLVAASAALGYLLGEIPFFRRTGLTLAIFTERFQGWLEEKGNREKADLTTLHCRVALSKK